MTRLMTAMVRAGMGGVVIPGNAGVNTREGVGVVIPGNAGVNTREGVGVVIPGNAGVNTRGDGR